MNAHESYVSLETAKLLKQAGFNWECSEFYYSFQNDEWIIRSDYQRNYNDVPTEFGKSYSAPTLAIAQKWLREIKNIEVQVEWYVVINGIINSFDKRQYECSIQGPMDMPHMCYAENGFKTYEEALEAGILKCLTLLIEQL